MKINNCSNESFKDKLIRISKEYNLEINDKIASDLEKYKDILLEWNEKINLTAITEENEIIVKHFIDCLECTKYVKENDKIVDVGTGAGFPGIIIAIYFQGRVELTLVDALNKRIMFLQEVVKTLNIKNVNIINSRSEELSNDSFYREKFDIVTARAVSSLNILLECTIALIKKQGKCIYMKGDNVNEELKTSVKTLATLNCEVININEYILKCNNEDFRRSILEILKIEKTPMEYPRNYGSIKKKPL